MLDVTNKEINAATKKVISMLNSSKTKNTWCSFEQSNIKNTKDNI